MFASSIWIGVPACFVQPLAPTGEPRELLLLLLKSSKKKNQNHLQNDWARKEGEILGQKMGS